MLFVFSSAFKGALVRNPSSRGLVQVLPERRPKSEEVPWEQQFYEQYFEHLPPAQYEVRGAGRRALELFYF